MIYYRNENRTTKIPRDIYTNTTSVIRRKALHYNELRKQVRDRFYLDLPRELLDLTTKSGDILILNRIGWAKAYLKQAGIVSQPERAMVQITDKGRAVLANGILTLAELRKDPEFIANQKVSEEISAPEI